ncbi:MAG: DegT/DnrJ/EryC1/StrS family aminotransferase [Chloroflexota bacterium]
MTRSAGPVAITGADGRLGSALLAACAARGLAAIPWRRTDLDLDRPDGAPDLVARDRPGLVIHAAAWTDVDGCALAPDLAMRRNADATGALARAAAAAGAGFLYVSTNEVFDGERTDGRGYREDDPRAPRNAYGRSKAAGEDAARAAYADAPEPLWIARVAWLFGPPGEDFPARILRAADRLGPDAALSVVADEEGAPTYAPDLAEAILDLVARAPGGTWHLGPPDHASRASWARAILAARRPGRAVRDISRTDFQRASDPPPWGVLDPSAAAAAGVRMRPWADALAAHLAPRPVAAPLAAPAPAAPLTPVPAGPGPAKRVLDDLACLGGPPLFAEPRHVGRPNIGDRQVLRDRFEHLLDARWLTNDGPMVKELEARLRDLTGAGFAIAVANATVGLEIAARAAELTGEVIVPSFTFVATANALRWIGLEPVFCDVDPDSLTIDPAAAARLIGPRTSAILGVHVYGRLCDTDALDALGARHGLRVLYDAAHALGCRDGRRTAGTAGDAEVFSLHATKFVNGFEGGVITTDDPGLAERAQRLRNFGFVTYERTSMVGINGKMHEASAAMALTSLEAMERFVAVNRGHSARYQAGLAGVPGVTFLAYEHPERTNAQYAVARVDAGRAGLDRDTLQAVLAAEQVLARRYFAPGCHRLEPYRSERPDVELPVTDRAAAEVLSLPTGTGVTTEDVDAIVEIIRFAVANAGALAKRLPLATAPHEPARA